ncbi:pantoate--beta-alanine ligase [Alphaproteobacteria bacterium]|nr:pantoate--beta-alanine ligase [Alphaproteobacteria bacterium]
MIISRTRKELEIALNKLSEIPGKLALIPTMGNLHQGHLSLLTIAKKKAYKTISTIFVNPLQFGKNDDFEKYPRTHEDDIKKLNDEGCDLLFLPLNNKEVFSSIDNIKTIKSGTLGLELCGKIRPGHFDGVLTVVNRLFEIIKPDIAVFGAKDYQQEILIRQMAKSLYPNLELIKAPIIRADNGVALSSRNNYLSEPELEIATNLYKCLYKSSISYKENIDLKVIIDEAKKYLNSYNLSPDYFELRDENLNKINVNGYDGKKAFLGSVNINKTRLIDNIEF